MLTQNRRTSVNKPRAFRKLVRIAGKLMLPEIRMIDLHDKFTMLGLRIVEELARRVYRGRRQSLRLELLKESFHVIVHRARFDQLVEQRPERKAVLHIFQLGIY